MCGSGLKQNRGRDPDRRSWWWCGSILILRHPEWWPITPFSALHVNHLSSFCLVSIIPSIHLRLRPTSRRHGSYSVGMTTTSQQQRMPELSVLAFLMWPVKRIARFEGFLYPLDADSMHTAITALSKRSFIAMLMSILLADWLFSSLQPRKLLVIRFQSTVHYADNCEWFHFETHRNAYIYTAWWWFTGPSIR